ALDMLLFNLIDLCRLAYGSLSVQEMFDIVQSIPKTGENGALESKKEESPKAYDRAMETASERLREKLQEWEAGLSTETLAGLSDEKSYRDLAMKEVPEYRQLHYVQQFFEDNFIPLSEKTRS